MGGILDHGPKVATQAPPIPQQFAKNMNFVLKREIWPMESKSFTQTETYELRTKTRIRNIDRIPKAVNHSAYRSLPKTSSITYTHSYLYYQR